MTIIFETPRLLFREFRVADAPAMWALNANPEVIRYTGDPPFDSVEEAKRFIEQYDHYQLQGFGRWAVLLKDGKSFIGWCGLKRHSDGMVDIGFRFFQDQWRKGYATEAARATLDYAFHQIGLPEVIGRAARANGASIRVLEKLGMHYWKDDTCEGIDDSVYFRIAKSSWPNTSPEPKLKR